MSGSGYLRSKIARRFEESIRVKRAITGDMVAEIENIITSIIASLKAGGKVVLFDNGGSAADTQHIAGELVGKLLLERQALPAIALNTNISILTALANDYGYESVFRRQVEALVNENDIVIGISTSGNSPNVIEALEAAKLIGAKTVTLTEGSGGKMSDAADINIIVPSDVTPRIQEAHITIGHIICEMVEIEMAGSG
ncbi:SIS domain-containing protein [Chloroflexota bacterium]